MKNTQLVDEEKKRLYKIVRPRGKSFEELEEEVKKIYMTIPKKERSFIGDATAEIKGIVSSIIAYESEGKRVRPKNVFYDIIRERKRSGYYGTKQVIFTAFREQKPSLFAKYNSYMFRRGEKSTQYFYENADLVQKSAMIWEAILELPQGGRVPYETLTIGYDFSSQIITGATMF